MHDEDMVLQENRATDRVTDKDVDATDLLKSTNLQRTLGEVEAGMPLAEHQSRNNH